MKVGPKSSLRPFLHRALQLFPEVEVNSGISFNRHGYWGIIVLVINFPNQ